MNDIEFITKNFLIKFRDKRNWGKYHTPENLSKSICIEAAELLECFQWPKEINKKGREDIKEEIADIAIYLFTLCHELDINLVKAIESKIKLNAIKYPTK